MSDQPELLPHQQRVVDELNELSTKVGKLNAFIETKLFDSLDESEKDRLRRQFAIMMDYQQVLAERIGAW